MDNIGRDYELFPDDSTGAVLWHMKSNGDNLTAPREVDFTGIFPSEESALHFAITYLRNGFKVEMFDEGPNTKDDLNWNVTVYTVIVPTHAEISGLEEVIAAHAQELGGSTDGWSSVFVEST